MVLPGSPSVALIRAVFGREARRTRHEMQRHVPGPVDARTDLRYAPDRACTFDLYRPPGTHGAALPVVVWIHGGAWISGSKRDVRPYVQTLAARSGLAAASLGYTVAPRARYPTAVLQLAGALRHLAREAASYGLDPDRIVIAGDSAGANLTSALALAVTSPAYTAGLGIEPPLRPDQLRGVVLCCGVYDVSGVRAAHGLGGWGFRQALRSYLGPGWATSAAAGQMSTLAHVTADFPPTWISGGNGDPLTPHQSEPLAHSLADLGVDVTALFFPDDHDPALPHEYQFHLDRPEAREALGSMLQFLDRLT